MAAEVVKPALVDDPFPRLHRLGIWIVFVVPIAGLAVAVWQLWSHAVGWLDLALMASFYVATMLGVTVGFHRLLTHRAFEARPSVRLALAVIGSMAVQGPVINWVADHRRHHAFSDRDGDPHSPHVTGESGGVLRGLWHAHAGWMLAGGAGLSDHARYAPELVEDRAMRVIDRLFLPLALLGLALPFALGAIAGGTIGAGLTALLWAGLVRVFLTHHVSWSVNSLCHFAGHRRFATDDHSTNFALLALPSMGEAWHHNHHAFPRSAFHGLRARELDPSGWLIWLLERMRLASKPVRISPERQRERLAERSAGDDRQPLGTRPARSAEPSEVRP